MTTTTTIDHDKVMQAARALKANPPTEAEISKDPIAFLEAQGISLGSNIEAMIRAKGAMSIASAPRQAAIIHIDA